MEYTDLHGIPYFTECSAAVEPLGFLLVELQVVTQRDAVHITAVIASKNPGTDIGVADCSKVHHVLQPKLTALLGRSEDDVYMEVCSPGIERNIKNAAEFRLFAGRMVRVWDKNVGDWVSGKIISADESRVSLESEGGGIKAVAYCDIAKAKFLH